MAWHNHEENISLAREWIATFKEGDGFHHFIMKPAAREELTCLLQSFIEDVLVGHAKIEELDKLLEVATIRLKGCMLT